MSERKPDIEVARLPRWAAVLVHVLFFCSGAAALVYEVVWMRMLSFVFGNTTYAVSVVLAVFLAGLAIGAFLYGRVADRRGDLLRVYGLLEAGAALTALALPWLLLGVLTPVYTWIDRWAGESTLALAVARLVLSGALLAVPAILLGGTLPVLIRFLVRGDRGMEAHIGRLYGLNTLGAVAGSIGAGFLLMPGLGVRGANAVGAGLGLCVAAAALVTHRALGARAESSPEWQPRRAPEPESGSAAEAMPSAVPEAWLLVAFALSGFAALAYEVLWTRLLVFFFESSVYAFSAMLGVYLLGLALGGLVYSVFISRSSRQLRCFVVLEVLAGVSAAATVPAFVVLAGVQVRVAEAMGGSFWGHMGWIFLVTLVIMILPTLLIGALFPLVCALRARSTGRLGRGIGEVYIVNTLGTVAGSLGAGFLLVPAIGTRLALLSVAGLNSFAGLLVWSAASRERRQMVLRGAIAVAAPAALALVLSAAVSAEDLAAVYKHGERQTFDIEWLKEGIDGTVTIETVAERGDALTGIGGDRRLVINGVNVAGTRIDFHTTQKLQAHLALLVRAGAEHVLQVGFGSGGTAYSASRHPVKRVDCVELSRVVIAAAPQFEETNHGVLGDDRIHLHIEDARSYVKHAPHAYDVILSDSTHPVLAGEGLLYSVDYLRDCAARLKPDGIFSTWMPLHGIRLAEVKVIVRSIREAFPYTYIWHTSVGRNEWCIVHGMRQPLRIDYDRFAREAAIPEVRQDLAQIGLDSPDTLLALLLYDHEAVNKWLRDVDQLNTDDNGYLEFVGPRGVFQFRNARTLNFLLTFPDFVLSAGGCILDYVVGPGGDGAPWRQRIRRELSANQHILAGRLYEFGRQDSYISLARMEYQKALELVPGHYVAQRMLGLAPRQIDWAREATRDENAYQMAPDQLAAAETALGRLEEAAKWARQMARPGHSYPTSGPAAIVALLRKDRDELARILQESAHEGGAAEYLGITKVMFQQALDTEDAVAAAPGDAQKWCQLGIIYQEMAVSISRNTPHVRQRPLPALQVRSFRMQAMVSLVSLARSYYEVALSLDPGDIVARYGLASVLAAQGEYREAAEVLRSIDRQSVEQAWADISFDELMELAAALQEKERDPFGFIADVQTSMLERESEKQR